MSDIRILFTDLDGTLLDSEKKVTPGNQAAIDEALALGHKIVVCSGRPLASAKVCAANAGLTKEGCYVIAFNGAQIYDPYHEKTVHENTFQRETAIHIVEEALKRNLHIHGYTDTEILTVKDTPEVRKYAEINKLPVKVVGDSELVVPQNPHKLIAIDYDNKKKNDLFREEVILPLASEVHSFFSNDWYQEIVPAGITKGTAIKWFCNWMNIPIENSVAAGDAANDIEMLETAHVGAVMCNAFPGIAEHGNYVTEHDNDHDGVAEIIRKFVIKK